MKKLFGILCLVFLFSNTMQADNLKTKLIKPNNNIEPQQVVKIQLLGLMNNDNPNKDNGIKQTWEFAHPSNKKNTGPLSSFIN